MKRKNVIIYLTNYIADEIRKKGRITMNKELINELKHVKKVLVSKQLIGDDWEDQQTAVRHLEEVVTYLNDSTAKGIDFSE